VHAVGGAALVEAGEAAAARSAVDRWLARAWRRGVAAAVAGVGAGARGQERAEEEHGEQQRESSDHARRAATDVPARAGTEVCSHASIRVVTRARPVGRQPRRRCRRARAQAPRGCGARDALRPKERVARGSRVRGPLPRGGAGCAPARPARSPRPGAASSERWPGGRRRPAPPRRDGPKPMRAWPISSRRWSRVASRTTWASLASRQRATNSAAMVSLKQERPITCRVARSASVAPRWGGMPTFLGRGISSSPWAGAPDGEGAQ
jgi:hypothetical protein